ncbi:hypothetical protein [Cloacibacterium normanense]
MKNLLTLFAIILSVGVANAQTKKPVAKKTDTPTKAETTVVMKGPTKEETIEYIKNEIGENVKNLTATSILFGNLFKAEYIKEISISDCTLTIKTIIESSNEQKRKVENEIVTIPLNKIQNIEIVNDKQESGQITGIQIKFTTYQKQNLITINDEKEYAYYLSLSKMDSKSSEAEPTRDLEKLTKAFNHLRKLCGAPEPISFD